MLAFSVEGNHDKLTRWQRMMKRMSTYHISLQWSCFSLTLHKETLHTECHYLALLDYIERSWTFYNHIFHVPCINHTEELKIPTTFFVFSGLSRFGLEAISAEQFSDCQVFAPGHFGGWRLIIEFLYSSVLKHARALLAALLLLAAVFPIGAQATVRLLENEPNITVQAGGPCLTTNIFTIFHLFPKNRVQLSATISTRSCGEAPSWTCCDPERNPWNVSFNVWVWARVSRIRKMADMKK